jgi:hypothetical protein
MGEMRNKTTHIPVFVFYIEKEESEERARKKYVQGILNLLISMNISVLRGV